MISREEFIIFCARFVRLPYIWGGSNPKVGLDCSGLSQILLARLGLDPEHDQTAHGLHRELIERGGTLVKLEDADLGDQVFFGKPSKITHVGTVLGGGQMIEAANGGSWATNVEVARLHDACTKINPITRRNDIVAIVRPKGLPWEAK